MRIRFRARACGPASCAARPVAAPMLPSRVRIDPDRVVGLACVALLPLALWLVWS